MDRFSVRVSGDPRRSGPLAVVGVIILAVAMVYIAVAGSPALAAPRRALPGALRQLVPTSRMSALDRSRAATSLQRIRDAEWRSPLASPPADPAVLAAARVAASASVSPAQVPPLPGADPMGTRIVRPGDTLYGIALQQQTSVATLVRLNGLGARAFLLPGRRLWVPMGRAAAFPGLEAGVPTGAQPDRAADRWPVDPDSAGHLRYTVQPGDTLYDIAERFGARPESLETINDLADAFISPGDILRVPRSGTGPAGAEGPKEIEVDIGEQRLRAWQGGRLVWNFLASTGLSGYPTRRGEFVVQSKVDDAWSSAWQLWMPHWLGIYWAGGSENGIHALPIKADSGTELWAGFLGSPISYGCIVISPEAASALYDWAELETPVVIHD